MPGPRSRVDFAAIAAAALSRAESLVAQWLPAGKREGHEWKCGSLSGEAGDSCSINLDTGAWADFATDERGGDLISLYAAINNLSNGAAARELAEQLGMTIIEDGPRAGGAHEGSSGGAGASARSPGVKIPSLLASGDQSAPSSPNDDDRWTDAGSWPPDGPEPPRAHTFRGVPPKRWAYTDAAGKLLGYVCRFVTSDGGKEIIPLVWSKHPKRGTAWKWRAFSEPRPLYGLARLAAHPDLPVLLVEGEKCADAAQDALGGDWVVVTWPGGSKAVDKADWSPLAGRHVVAWPDCDAKLTKDRTLKPEAKQPGVAAMERVVDLVHELVASIGIVVIPAPGEKPDGWDVADLIAEEGAGAIWAWLAPDRRRAPAPREPARASPPNPNGAPQGEGEGPPPSPPDDPGPPPDHGGRWQDRMLWNGRKLAKHAANVALILQNDHRWRGVIAYDDFAQRTMKRAAPPYAFSKAGEWTDDDDTRTSVWLAQQYSLETSSQVVGEAVQMVARESAFHPVRDWLRSLTWDRQDRLTHWLIDCAGVEDTPYVRLVSKYFLVGMVRRVMEPGCKFDYCLVLEGQEGLRKSSLAAVLGGHWASDSPLDLTHKDSMAALQGKWVHEFSEMESVTRAEAHLQKSFLSRTFDEFRPVYARRHIRCPRQCVFIGTTNESEYIKEGQGARRFWPIEIPGEINIDGLRANLEQLLAEAVALYDAGERSHPSPDEQRDLFTPQQHRRVQQESLVDALHDWVLDPLPDEANRRVGNGGMFSLVDAAYSCLKINYAQLTRDLQTRVGKALTALGCTKVEKRNGMTRYWYKPPAKKGGEVSVGARTGHPMEADDAPPF